MSLSFFAKAYEKQIQSYEQRNNTEQDIIQEEEELPHEEEEEEEIFYENDIPITISKEAKQYAAQQKQQDDATSLLHSNQPFDTQYTATVPPMPPLPASILEDESLTNLILSWYYSGYYTGYYDASMQNKK